MRFFDRLFRKKPTLPIPDLTDEGEDKDEIEDYQSASAQAIQGPQEFVRAVGLQRAYWTHNSEEQSQLEARGVEHLSWRERLRLHHLICMQRLKPGSERAVAAEKCRKTTRRLLASDSPFRARQAMIWQWQLALRGSQREPGMQGEFLNASLTHLGCLEIYRVDAGNQPMGIDFVGFDELAGVIFAAPKLVQAAKLLYDDGRGEMVLVPLLYGLTWAIGHKDDRAGRMTRFVAHLDGEEIGTLGASGMGVGQQDFSIRNPDGAKLLFGLGSVAEISFPLDMRDPRFDEKVRARGIDPEDVRRRMSR